jgi:hypothetical protein
MLVARTMSDMVFVIYENADKRRGGLETRPSSRKPVSTNTPLSCAGCIHLCFDYSRGRKKGGLETRPYGDLWGDGEDSLHAHVHI